ncbi:MAG: hypothetical protein GX213_00660 [Clostridiaceae bacterium]|nr:hypothetical protein [Clostridiaceae bacterium]
MKYLILLINMVKYTCKTLFTMEVIRLDDSEVHKNCFIRKTVLKKVTINELLDYFVSSFPDYSKAKIQLLSAKVV